MKLYADTGARRTRQVVADLLFVLWIVGWVWFGVAVHDKTLALAGPGRDAESAGASLADGLGDAGGLLDGVPLVGDRIEETFEKAAGASTKLSEAGRQEVEAVEDLSIWLGVAVVAIPVMAAVPFHLPGRVRFVREASAMSRLLAVHYDRDLLALRALARLPLREITSLGPDPADAWRRRDPRALDALAAAELRSHGLRPPGATRRTTVNHQAQS
ncbi:hypothetical protein [Nocardioides pacificus]